MADEENIGDVDYENILDGNIVDGCNQQVTAEHNWKDLHNDLLKEYEECSKMLEDNYKILLLLQDDERKDHLLITEMTEELKHLQNRQRNKLSEMNNNALKVVNLKKAINEEQQSYLAQLKKANCDQTNLHNTINSIEGKHIEKLKAKNNNLMGTLEDLKKAQQSSSVSFVKKVPEDVLRNLELLTSGEGYLDVVNKKLAEKMLTLEGNVQILQKTLKDFKEEENRWTP